MLPVSVFVGFHNFLERMPGAACPLPLSSGFPQVRSDVVEKDLAEMLRRRRLESRVNLRRAQHIYVVPVLVL